MFTYGYANIVEIDELTYVSIEHFLSHPRISSHRWNQMLTALAQYSELENVGLRFDFWDRCSLNSRGTQFSEKVEMISPPILSEISSYLHSINRCLREYFSHTVLRLIRVCRNMETVSCNGFCSGTLSICKVFH